MNRILAGSENLNIGYAGHSCELIIRHFGLKSTSRPSFFAFYNAYEEVDTFVQVLHELHRPWKKSTVR